jgi:hypothetical protein
MYDLACNRSSCRMLTHNIDFEAHFKEVFRKHSRSDRPFFIHVTSVVVSIPRAVTTTGGLLNVELITRFQDTKGTTVTLSVVEDSILRRHLVTAQLL